jgi:hypothetical protein
MDNLNKTIDTFYELQLKLKEHDKKELKSSSWKSFVIAFRESLAPSKPQTQFKPQQLPSKNPPQLHHKKDSPKKAEPTSPPKPNISKYPITDKTITHDIINKPKQQQQPKPLIQSQSSIKKDLPNKSPYKPLNEFNPDRTPDAIDSCGSFGNDGDVSPELKPCDKLSPVYNSNNSNNNINKVNKDNLYLVNNSNNNNKIKNGIEVNKTRVIIPLSIFGNPNIKYIEDLEPYINKERSRENSQNSKHYNNNSNTKQHISGNNIKQTITSPNHNYNTTSSSSSIINKNNSNIKRSLPLHHYNNPLKQSKPLTNNINNNISSSLTTLQQPKKDSLKTYLDIFDKSISKLKNEYNEKALHIQNPTRLNPITSTFKDISILQLKNKSLLESSSSSTDKQHKEQSIIYNTLSILKLICTVFETVDKCELLFNKNKEIFSSLIDVLKCIKSKYKENDINKSLWLLNQSKLIVKFIMSLILLKSYTHSKLKELISNDNSNKMKNMIEFIKVYDSYSKTVVAIRNHYTNTIEEIKDNNKNKKILIESVVEYLKKEPNAMKYRTCFSLAKKIIDITLDSNTINTNNNN